MKVFYPRWLPVHGIAVNTGLVLIRRDHEKDAGLHAHEWQHARQMRDFGAVKWWLLYLVSRDFRLRMETEAYRESVKFSPHRLEHFAQTLSGWWPYFLGISVERARELLTAP